MLERSDDRGWPTTLLKCINLGVKHHFETSSYLILYWLRSIPAPDIFEFWQNTRSLSQHNWGFVTQGAELSTKICEELSDVPASVTEATMSAASGQ